MQIEDLPDVTLQRVPTPIFRKDAHLSSALITTEIEYMFEHRNNPRAIKREHRELLDRIQDSHVRECNQFIPWIMENWKDLSHTGESIAMLMTALRVATHALRISVLDYIGIDHTINLTPTEELLTVYKAKRNFDKIIKHITYSKEFHQNYLLGKYKGDVYGNLHVIWEKEKVCWVVTHSHFVCIRDMINSWFDALLYGLVASQKYPPYNFYYEIEKVLKHGRLLVSHHGQKAYSLFKLWPSLIIASILRDTENKRNFFAALLKDVEIFVNTPFYQYTTAPITSDAQVHMLLELSGMWKCFGHPNINMSASVNAWKEKGSVGKNISPHMANLIDWAFKLEFCRQYYKQHKRWPAVKMGSHAPMKIKRNYQNNTWDETPSRKWAPEDFEHVTLQKNLDFDYHVDMSDLLADKSIIPSRSQWIYEYDRQAHRTLYGKFPYGPPQTSKSAIVHYLQLDSIDVKEVIDILQSGLIPDEWKIMVAVAKERELKDKSRFYGKMCFEMRLYQTATEKNIADPLFKYVKNQSMTMSEEQLLRTILRMNTPVLQIEGETYVFVVLDFSSWCTSFRLELITPLFITIDQLFGLHNVYSFTHYFPLISHLIFQDRFYPPEQGDDGLPKMGPRCYPYPEAWLEGLRQKGWTLATLLIILIASWTCGTSASLLGQGDNQVILLRIPPSSYLEAQQLSRDDYIEGFLRVLDDLCDKAGIIIKIEETWYSRNLFEYSRKYHYKGAQVSCCLKRISRLASEANLVAPSLSGILAGMYSTGSAAAAEDNTPMASYYCTVVEACLKLWEENEWMVKEPWEYTCCLLLITRCLGGYPITTYSQFCTRSVQDVLSTNLHLVRTASRDNILGPYIGRVVNLDVSIHKDFLSLVKDPQSLPLMQPVQPENFIKREIKKGLEHHIKNKDVKDLFSFSASESQDKLVRDLSNIKPCNPKLLNKLWSLSNIGLQERWTGMFANTRSIQQMAFKNWSDELDVIMSIRNMELQYSRHLQHKKSSHHIDDIKNCECITTYTQLTRERMWGLAMEGITMPPQQEQTRMVEWDTLTVNQAQRAILFTEQDDIPLIKTLSRGKFSPYFGSTTRLRARRSLLQVVEVGSVISSLKQLMELHGWVRGNPQMTSLIETLIKEKTTLSIEELQKYSQKVYSGSLTHRLPCPAMRRGGMANQNLNHSSFYTITSDTAIDYSKGGINYTICFQSVFLYGLSTLAHYTDIGVPFRKQMGLVFTCSKCTWVIPPESFSLNSNDYHGIQLPNMVKELHHKDVFERYPLHIQMDENISYSVQMARKTAAWIVGRRMIDKITSLDNRAMEENLTLSFVNLAEFSRLRVSMYLKSFIFYCAVYDPLFFTQQYDYFNEVLEGISKNPYDVILDNLRRCGHTRELCTMQGGPPKHSYTISEMRTLLYNILTSLCEDYKGILTSAYILTQEDGLPVVIRAIQVWLQVNEIPCYITSDMTSSELDSAIEKYYKGYHAIRPVTTLSEEETTYLIRASPIRTLTQEDRRYITLPIRRNIQSSHQETNYEGVEYLWIIEENAVLSSLAEVMQSPTFLEKCEGHHLVTLGDKDGTGYTLLYHTWIFLPGYPHYHETVDWEKDPHSITCDSCNIEWNRRDYYCNGPKSIVDIPSNCLVVIFPHCPTLFGMRPDTLVLQYYTTSTHPPGDVYWCLAHTNREGRWVLHKAEGLITGDKQYISDVTLTNSMTALSHLRSYLSVHLRESMCFSPFAEVSHMLGCVPQTPTALILVLKSRIRGVLMSWIVTRGRPTSYEGIIEAEKQKRRRILKLRRIATYHVVYNMLLQKPWHATGIIGRYPYHTHVRGYTRRVCWSRCREGVSVLDVSSLSIIEYHMRTWLRYLWIICSEESARHGTMKAPSLKFLPF